MADADPPRSAPPVPRAVPPAPLVAAAAWLLPGAGYWLIGQPARGTTIGACILGLFMIGLLVGGVRVIEVPGYVDETGERHMIDVPGPVPGSSEKAWGLEAAPLGELRDKPWSLPQAMTGPVAVAAGWWSVIAAGPDPVRRDADGKALPIGALTHARINEIGSLYLSVAGLLNLMAIIDAAHRAVHLSERRRAALAAADQGAA